MNLPTHEECLQMLKQYHVPEHIVEHVKGVNKVAVLIANEVGEKGIDVNVELVDRASLLHDMLRLVCLTPKQWDIFSPKLDAKSLEFWENMREKYNNESHEEAIYLELKEKYPEIAEVLRTHGYKIMENPEELKTWEQKIVNYADKRVMHDVVVSLAERFEEGHKRNEENEEGGIDTDKIDSNCFELEKQMFKNLDITPEEIKKLIEDG